MQKHLLGLALLSLSLPAQHAPDDPFGHSRHGTAFDEGPRQAAYRMAGMSNQVHLPVAGLSAEAQAFFDQGVCQQHGFWYFESERSFRQVAKLHPDCAMAYLGMVWANIENPARAAGFLASAVERSAAVPRYEQLWIDAWATFHQLDAACRDELRSGDKERVAKAKAALVAKAKVAARDDKPVKEARQKQLIKDLGTLVHEFPDDVEAKAFLAVHIWYAHDWTSGIPIVSHTAVDSLLDQVFAKAPLHPAHHYRIHLWDQEKAERALPSAAKNGSTAPGIAHQWHMAGHIYAKLHRHPEAAWQQEASARVDHAFMLRDRVMPFEIHNYGHNQEWLAQSLSYDGRVEAALDIAKNLAELPRHPKKNRIGDGDSIAGYARQRLASLCDEHELWDVAVQLAQTGHLEASDGALAEVVRLSLLGRALFRLGRLDEAARIETEAAALLPKARAERARLLDTAEDEAIADKVDRKLSDAALDEARKRGTDVVRMVQDLQRELRGERLLAQGDAKGAVAEFTAIEGFPKFLLADAHVAAGDPGKAIELLEAEVKENPHQLPTLGRLLCAYVAADKPEQKPRMRELMNEIIDLVGVTEAELSATPLLRRVSIGVDVRGIAKPKNWSDPTNFGADFGPRPPLASLGPVRWSPAPAPALDLPSAAGGRFALAAQRGKPTLVVFYLGFGCLHCVQQLEALSPKAKDFAAAGIQVVAVGNETLAKTQDNVAALGDKPFGFPLLADPELGAFKAWRCFDDFEGMPLHGTFLVDGDGRVRWQDVGAEPFVEIDWLLAESRRLLALPAAAGSK
jgi:peroxiredoxin/tetratricopeptide (TPR) repeat protein